MSLITDHIQQAKDRLLEQYKGKATLEDFIEAIVQPLQDSENVLDDLEFDRWLETAAGVQLDKLGIIVGIAREAGQLDADYRISLKTKVVENTSQGEPERVISVYKILVGATLVYLDELAIAGIGLSSEVGLVSQEAIDRLFARIGQIVAATVRVEYLASFDATEPFAFAGILGGRGFGSTTDPLVGGKFATLYIDKSRKFAFDGLNPNDGGFGTILDPLVGGVMVGL